MNVKNVVLKMKINIKEANTNWIKERHNKDQIYLGNISEKVYLKNIKYKLLGGLIKIKNKDYEKPILIQEDIIFNVYETKEELNNKRDIFIKDTINQEKRMLKESRNKNKIYLLDTYYNKYILNIENIDKVEMIVDVNFTNMKLIENCITQNVAKVVDIKTFKKILNNKQINNNDLL